MITTKAELLKEFDAIVENYDSGPSFCRIENYLTTFNKKSCQFFTGYVDTATIADKVFYLSIGN